MEVGCPLQGASQKPTGLRQSEGLSGTEQAASLAPCPARSTVRGTRAGVAPLVQIHLQPFSAPCDETNASTIAAGFSGMQPRPSFDRTLLIPIVISVLSILGIGWIFLTSNLRETFNPPTTVPTAIPFDIGPLETEAASLFPSATSTREETEETPPTATETESVAYPGPGNERLASTSTESRPTPSDTPTPARIQPLTVGQYDDTDPNIAYDSGWIALKNPSTVNEYKGTIHASTGIGNEASFRFTGDGFWLGYKRGKSFGTVTVLVDNQSYSFHEQDFGLVWRSPELPSGDHFVRIIHESGGSINLDYLVILD
jgi:hypothetical protein